MAVPRPLAALLLLVTMSVIPAALASRIPASDNLVKACKATSEAGTCENVLKSEPESATASPRWFAELAFKYLVTDGPVVVAEAKSAVKAAATKDEGTRNCLQTLDENISAYVDPVVKLQTACGEAQFTEAKNKLTELLRWPSNSGAVCPDAAIKSEPVVLKVYKYERMLQITLDLMNAAPAPSKADAEKWTI